MKKAKIQQEQEANAVTNWLELFASEPSLNTLSSPSEYDIKNSKLELQLFDYFSNVVPSLLEKSGDDGFLKFNTRAEDVRTKICEQLEYFISGGVSDDGIKTLACYSKPQKFCGKVFNMGDLTYSCKTCAQDPTCVFCHFCFHNSVHKNHRHKLHASCGTGGYCDCGDEEAWSSDPACDYHKGGMNNDESWDPFSSLPEDIQCRATFIFKFVLQYIMEVLIVEEYEEDDDKEIILPLDLSCEEPENSHIVMLYNDESHTYEEVISTLTESIKCSKQQAYQFAAIVDKEGRSSIYYGESEVCDKIASTCKTLTTRNAKSSLKCKSMHRNVVAHQLVALDIMAWMSEIMDVCDGLRRLLCLLVTVKISGMHRNRSISFLEVIIRQDTSLWKVARARSHQLFMNVVLMDTYGRKEFAVLFAECYKLMIEDFIVDDHEHSISVAALSVQIFTVPSLANMLILEGNILKTCLESFLKKVQPAIAKNGNLDFQDTASVNINRANYILNDVLYLLRHKPVWTPEFANNFLDAFDVFVDTLKIMQGMDTVVRKTQAHVTYEPNWETAFNLQLGMIPVIRAMLSWCYSDADILKSAIHRCVFTLRSLQPLKYTTVEQKPVVNHDVSNKSVSIHYALSRFLAGLLPGSAKFGLNLHELLQMEPNPDESMVKLQLQILEYPLRALVLSAQVNAHMWKRNGYAIQHQTFCYHNVRFVSEMSDRDILLLQVLACVMDHDHFIKVLLHKYNLTIWSKGTSETPENLEKENVVAKDFLMVVLYILCERYVSGVSDVTTAQILEREIIHKLSLGPTSRSALIKNIPFKDSEDEDDCSFESLIDGILQNVASYREPGITGKGVFELKEDSFAKCNKYFIHFTRTEQSKMVEEKKRVSKKFPNQQVSYLHPPPEFNDNFKNVINLVCCNSLLKLLRVILARAVKEDRSSEDHVEEVLMIIAVGLIELQSARKHSIDFPFLELLKKENSDGKSFINLIDELLANDSKEYHSIAKWVKQLLQEEIAHGPLNMDIDSDSVVRAVSKEDEKAEKARIAGERKKKMMEQINKMQNDFMKNNSTLFDLCNDDEELMEESDTIEDWSHPVAIGDKHSPGDNTCRSVLCILCQEEQTIDSDNFFVVTSFVHKSNVLKTNIEGNRNALTPELSKPNMVNISSCGHIVHIQCWEKFFTSVKERENLPPFQRRTRSCIDISQTEYLCPLCNSLCNTVLPLLPRAPSVKCTHEKQENGGNMSLSEFLTYLERFSAAVMCIPKKESVLCNTESNPSAPRPSVVPSWASVLSTFLASYTGSDAAGASSENFMELFAKKLMKIFGNGVERKHVSYSVPYSWLACSFTLQAYECCTRVEKGNIFANLTDRKDIFWNALIQYLANYCMIGVYEPVQDIGNVLFNFFCGVDSEISLSLLDADIFGILISLRFLVGCIQNIFQEEEPKLMNSSPCVIDDIVFRICFVASLVKIYITAPLFVADEGTVEEDEEIVKSWRYVQDLLHINHSCRVDAHRLKEHVLDALLPFMRCSAVFFHYLTGVKFPDNLIQGDGEMTTLQKYLNLPEATNDVLSLETFTSEPLVQKMIERWCMHEKVAQHRDSLTSIPCYVQARRLIQLPKEYSTLINRVSGFICPTLKNDSSRVPTLCLVCDKILCSQCYCCVKEVETRRYGACSTHSMECCSGTGIFLRIRDSEIVLMYNQSKCTFLPSPYLDEYGETDRGFRRGNPLYLNQKRFESLEQLWLRQRIPETIAQAMESNRGPNHLDWHQL